MTLDPSAGDPLAPPPSSVPPEPVPPEPGRPAWAPPIDEVRGARRPAVLKAIAGILLVVVVFTGGMVVGEASAPAGSSAGATAGVPASLPPEFSTYLQAWQILHDNYVDPIALDPKTLVYGSIDGLTAAIGDTGHTRFLSPQDRAAEQTSLSGSIFGVGAIMTTESGGAVIQSVIPGGPADRAGLRSGDHVLAVDGTPTDGQDLQTVVSRIRGAVDTTVNLTILHQGESSPIVVSIVRAKVVVPAVSWALAPGTTIADLRLEEFSTGSGKEVRNAIASARAAGAKAIVLDLRGNPGGYVPEVVAIASEFIGHGLVYQQRDRTGKTTTVAVKGGGTATTIPLAVLIDHGSASAAEILAGALQDAKRGQLVGRTTFGTGTVLKMFPLADGSALFVGTIEWLTRDGRQIWKHGVVPDIGLDSNPLGRIVTPFTLQKLDAAGLSTSGDLQLLKAIAVLKGS
jgi:carboxyl-terminal processing protease